MKRMVILTVLSTLIVSGCSSNVETTPTTTTQDSSVGSVKESNDKGVSSDDKSFTNDVVSKNSYTKTPKFVSNNMNIVKKSGPIDVILNAIQVSELYVIDNTDPRNYGLENGKNYPIIQMKLDVVNTGSETVQFPMSTFVLKTNSGNSYSNVLDNGHYVYAGGYKNSVTIQFILKDDNISSIKQIELSNLVTAMDNSGVSISGAEPVSITLDIQ